MRKYGDDYVILAWIQNIPYKSLKQKGIYDFFLHTVVVQLQAPQFRGIFSMQLRAERDFGTSIDR